MTRREDAAPHAAWIRPGRAARWLLALAMLVALLAAAPSQAADASAPAPFPEATVVIFNRPVAVLRTSLFGTPPQERARRARAAIDRSLEAGGPGLVEIEAQPFGTVLKVDGQFAFAILPEDVDRTSGETVETTVAASVARLREAIAATRSARQTDVLLKGAGRTAAATVIALLLVMAARVAARAAGRSVIRLAGSGAQRLKLGSTELLQRDRVVATARTGVTALHRTVLAVIAYQWLGLVLASFPYTHPWGERLNGFLVGVLGTVGRGILNALPDLVVALLIFVLAHLAVRGLSAFLTRAASAGESWGWLDKDTVGPARKLVTAATWLFAFAMAYPYLPGSSTEAFKGVSVLVGVMLSLGGSGLVSQAASGMVLMYTRTLRVGEFVSIGGSEGTIVALGTFATRIRTGRGDELSVPNSLVMNQVTRNYSRAANGRCFVVDTEVTIGYDTPWRQVHMMLTEAARRTPGVLADPAPRVFQTALGDFYPQYRLVCQAAATEPKPRADLLSTLHENIQDVFSENGVQIMSPHYLGDPASAKVVPPSRWDPGILRPYAAGRTGSAPQPDA